MTKKSEPKGYMVMDMQFGSTGKGLLAGYLATINQPDVVVTAWGPNAGHTYIDKSGRKFVHRMLANSIVSPKLKTLLIGPGSVIDPLILLQECLDCNNLLRNVIIVVHPHAAIVTENHVETEKSLVRIGSTMKGTGAAVIQRIMRDPRNSNVAADAFPQRVIDTVFDNGIVLKVSDVLYQSALVNAELIQIEGAQGFSLSMYHGFYPYCTSRDVTPNQVLADCAIPYGIDIEVYGTLRTFPIRVANRFDEKGNQIGSSGPCYFDQTELSWEELGVRPEFTTVTQLPRRIFSFSYSQLAEANFYCRPTKVFLNFVNYLKDYSTFMEMIDNINHELCGKARVEWVGIGPSHNNVHQVSYDEHGIGHQKVVEQFFALRGF